MPSRGKIVELVAKSDVNIDGLGIPAGLYKATERKADILQRRKNVPEKTYELHLNAQNLKAVRGFIGDARGASLDATRAVHEGDFLIAREL